MPTYDDEQPSSPPLCVVTITRANLLRRRRRRHHDPLHPTARHLPTPLARADKRQLRRSRLLRRRHRTRLARPRATIHLMSANCNSSELQLI